MKGDALPGHGLPCVTVLIGAYLRSSGKPVVGVINQPFYDKYVSIFIHYEICFLFITCIVHHGRCQGLDRFL